MPNYDFECQKCNEIFEISRKITDETDVKCPKCGSPDSKKLISKTNFVLKGPGWFGKSKSGGGY